MKRKYKFYFDESGDEIVMEDRGRKRRKIRKPEEDKYIEQGLDIPSFSNRKERKKLARWIEELGEGKKILTADPDDLFDFLNTPDTTDDIIWDWFKLLEKWYEEKMYSDSPGITFLDVFHPYERDPLEINEYLFLYVGVMSKDFTRVEDEEEGHAVLFVFDKARKCCRVFDSSSLIDDTEKAKRALRRAETDRREYDINNCLRNFSWNEYDFIIPEAGKIDYQMREGGGYDCGTYVMWNAFWLARNILPLDLGAIPWLPPMLPGNARREFRFFVIECLRKGEVMGNYEVNKQLELTGGRVLMKKRLPLMLNMF